MTELELVALTEDLPQHGLVEGDIGTVVLVHGQGEGYEVEFTALSGETVAVLTAARAQVRALGAGEIAHARPLAA